MIKRNESKAEQARTKQKRARRTGTYALIFACSLMLAGGFFFAAQQHFSSMDFGMKNSRLRRQVDELEAEKRRLVLAREISLSPSEVKKAVKKAGLMLETTPSENPVAQMVSTTKEKAVPPTAPNAKPMVVKTSAVTAVPPTISASDLKPEKVAKQLKKTVAAK